MTFIAGGQKQMKWKQYLADLVDFNLSLLAQKPNKSQPTKNEKLKMDFVEAMTLFPKTNVSWESGGSE